MYDCLRRAATLLGLHLAFVPAASAADIRPAQSNTGGPLAGITIEGSIALGDFGKLASLALATKGAGVVWLASPGGNLSEAMRMGALIRQLALEVRAPVNRSLPLVQLRDPGNNTCASACFFLYAAGVRREGSVLGIHKPSLPADEFFRLGLDGSAAAYRRIQEATANYLDLMGVPARYSSIMMATNSTEMIWLAPDDIARDLTGLASEYVDWVRDACRTRTVQLNSADVDCASEALAELQEELRQRTVVSPSGRRAITRR